MLGSIILSYNFIIYLTSFLSIKFRIVLPNTHSQKVIYMNREKYIELHSIEWDILNSDCADCYTNNLECLHYINKCRKEVKTE